MEREGAGTFAADVESLGALADPVRMALYRYVVAQPEPVSRDQAAEAVGVRRHQARFHLDRLESDGLLATSHARLTGRSGPGAGRPSKLYRRAEREFAVTLPDRDYELAGRLLSDAVAESARTGIPVLDAVNRSFAAYGEAAARSASGHDAPPIDAEVDALDVAARILAAHGYEPRREGERIQLHNCPFHALAQAQTALICNANLCLVAALADEVVGQGGGQVAGQIAAGSFDARLEPAPDRCCVVLEAT